MRRKCGSMAEVYLMAEARCAEKTCVGSVCTAARLVRLVKLAGEHGRCWKKGVEQKT